MIQKTLKEAAVIVLFSVAISIAVYAVRPDKIRIIGTAPPASQQETENTEYQIITIDRAISLFNEGDVLFADARSFSDYELGHVKGAVSLDLSDQDIWMEPFVAETEPETRIITYCDGPSCHLADSLAQILFFNGFDNVYCVKNGWTLWNENKMPVETVNYPADINER